jgi:DeoR family transcriptional regulator, fructose operon transcriptional repressor
VSEVVEERLPYLGIVVQQCAAGKCRRACLDPFAGQEYISTNFHIFGQLSAKTGTRMAAKIPEERRLAIAAAVRQQPLVRADELARRLGVSIETVRRDLIALEREGLLRRVYGGAKGVSERSFEPPVTERRRRNHAAKQAMGVLAAGLVRPGDTVIFDVGTSVTEAARQLPWGHQGRVLTSSLPVAAELDSRDGIEVLVSGGKARRGDMALSGPQTMEFFAGYYADKAILGSGGVHPQAGLTDYYPEEAAVRRVILSHAEESYVLADASKIGHIALCHVCDLSQVTAVITDSRIERRWLDRLREAGLTVLVAEAVHRQAAG